jgi:uncharacterized Zn finger protein (UPF0148 family)
MGSRQKNVCKFIKKNDTHEKLIHGLCMKGNIYTDEKCSICGRKINYREKNGLACPNHKKIKATSYRVCFGAIHKRFNAYEKAERFLNGLRFKQDEGILDERDYKKDNPNSLYNLTRKYLEIKKQTVKQKSYNNLSNYMERARLHFGDVNIKSIGYGEIEDFFISQDDISNKTKSNIKSCLHDFYKWLVKRDVLKDVPEFPTIKYNLKYRNIITKDTQKEIISEVRKISYNINPKIWLGIKLLATYISIRPGELIKLKEWQIKTDSKIFIFNEKKENKSKIIPMIDADAILIEDIRNHFDNNDNGMYFFRHLNDINRAKKKSTIW